MRAAFDVLHGFERAQQDGLFLPVKSGVLDSRIPANLRADDGSWYGFSTRARVIVYNKLSVKPNEVATYESLADPVNKGKVCTRSGSSCVRRSPACGAIVV